MRRTPLRVGKLSTQRISEFRRAGRGFARPAVSRLWRALQSLDPPYLQVNFEAGPYSDLQAGQSSWAANLHEISIVVDGLVHLVSGLWTRRCQNRSSNRDGNSGRAPVPNVIVHFVPENGHPSQGLADQQGKFTLVYDRTTKGAVVGMNKVYVEFRAKSPLEEGKSTSERSLTEEQREILNKYGNPQAPAIEVNIEKKNQHVEIKLD